MRFTTESTESTEIIKIEDTEIGLPQDCAVVPQTLCESLCPLW